MEIKHYLTPSGRAPVREYILQLGQEARSEILTLLRRLESGESLNMPHSRSLASIAKGLFELRVRDANGNVRVFYYTKIKSTIYIIHALRKKTRIIPENDRQLILKRIREIDILR
jgi:phage-related protein